MRIDTRRKQLLLEADLTLEDQRRCYQPHRPSTIDVSMGKDSVVTALRLARCKISRPGWAANKELIA